MELVCQALSEGDLEAAVSLFEPAAMLRLTARVTAREAPEIRKVLAGLMRPRLPVRVSLTSELVNGELALVSAERGISGTAIDGSLVDARGNGGAVLRRHPEMGWRVVADDWALADWSSPTRCLLPEPRAVRSGSGPARLEACLSPAPPTRSETPPSASPPSPRPG
ncbi:MAG: YybH family protein [Acidimicrobiales bacterium]